MIIHKPQSHHSIRAQSLTNTHAPRHTCSIIHEITTKKHTFTWKLQGNYNEITTNTIRKIERNDNEHIYNCVENTRTHNIIYIESKTNHDIIIQKSRDYIN